MITVVMVIVVFALSATSGKSIVEYTLCCNWLNGDQSVAICVHC